jgi:hypothetical protein
LIVEKDNVEVLYDGLLDNTKSFSYSHIHCLASSIRELEVKLLISSDAQEDNTGYTKLIEKLVFSTSGRVTRYLTNSNEGVIEVSTIHCKSSRMTILDLKSRNVESIDELHSQFHRRGVICI